MYLKLNSLSEAEVFFKKALEFNKLCNHSLGQGNSLQGMGRIQMARSQLQDAKILFEDELCCFSIGIAAYISCPEKRKCNDRLALSGTSQD